MTPKCSSKALRRAEANRYSRFGHARVLSQQQFLRCFHPKTQYGLADGFAGQRSPDSMEVKWRDRGGGLAARGRTGKSFSERCDHQIV